MPSTLPARTAGEGGPTKPEEASAAARGRAVASVALACLSVIWGYSWVLLKIATRDASPLAIGALRAALGAAVLVAFLAAARRPLRPPPFGPTLVLGLLQTVGFTVPQTVAVALGSPGRMVVLAYTMPFWLALLAWVFLGERIGRARWAALALAAAGLALFVGRLDARSLPASLLGVTSGVLWAASVVWALRTLLSRGYDLLLVTAWQMVWGAVVLGALALVFPSHVRPTPSFVASIAFLGIVANALGWAMWMFALSRLPAAVVGIGSLATPVVGVALAAAQLGEIPSRGDLMGMTFIVAALALNAATAVKRRRR